MYTALGEERLKTGETLRAGVVECPDPAWAERIVPFLGHKREETREHIRRALEGPLDALETRFYVGEIDGKLATEVMIVSARGAGILGHVYTRPEHRRKGAYSVLMRRQMADMARAGVEALTLSTRFDGHPYQIYHGFGFRGIGPGRGQMTWEVRPGAAAERFRPGPAQVRPARWDDWPWFDRLGMQPVAAGEALPRCAALGLKEAGSLESAFVPLLLERERDPRVQVQVLESAARATAGFAVLSPDRSWFGEAWIADLYVHPAFRGAEGELLEALEWPPAPVLTYRALPPELPDPGGGPWPAAGFRKAGTLPGWLRLDDTRRDVEIWVREDASRAAP